MTFWGSLVPDANVTCRPSRKSDAETTPSPSASHDWSRLNMDSKSELSVSANPLAVIAAAPPAMGSWAPALRTSRSRAETLKRT